MLPLSELARDRGTQNMYKQIYQSFKIISLKIEHGELISSFAKLNYQRPIMPQNAIKKGKYLLKAAFGALKWSLKVRKH